MGPKRKRDSRAPQHPPPKLGRRQRKRQLHCHQRYYMKSREWNNITVKTWISPDLKVVPPFFDQGNSG
ncbi:hypothetical protein LIER_29037 [Lithospermum erythrorhizon]|uniref:Uncharacterized protein n=1 Tax=Lithospermum erythrorhizon TaxID=34254 RepID=A0AAV3RLB8_LITER